MTYLCPNDKIVLVSKNDKVNGTGLKLYSYLVCSRCGYEKRVNKSD